MSVATSRCSHRRPVFARLLFFEVAEFELMLTGAAFGYFYGCRLVGEIYFTVFVRWTFGW